MSEHHHIVKPTTYVLNALWLGVLMVLTIVAARFHFGVAANFIVAMIIAVTKMCFIMLFFMHVKWASGLTRVFVGSGFLFLGIMLVLFFCDYLGQHWITAVTPPH